MLQIPGSAKTGFVRKCYDIGRKLGALRKQLRIGEWNDSKIEIPEYSLYSRKLDSKGKRKNLGTSGTRAAAERHERAVQYFKRAH